MIDEPVQGFVSVLQSAGVTGAPCDEWQVQDIEEQLGVKLPAAYKAFLLLAGQRFGLFEGSHYAVEDDLAELQRAGRRIARRAGVELPIEAFVFFVHQSVAVWFFLLDSGDDPAVHEYVEHSPGARQLAAHFSDCLLQQLGKYGMRRRSN
jgi:hypothetical protein